MGHGAAAIESCGGSVPLAAGLCALLVAGEPRAVPCVCLLLLPLCWRQVLSHNSGLRLGECCFVLNGRRLLTGASPSPRRCRIPALLCPAAHGIPSLGPSLQKRVLFTATSCLPPLPPRLIGTKPRLAVHARALFDDITGLLPRS